MARALTADPAPFAAFAAPLDASIVRLPVDAPPQPLAGILEPAILACEAAISYRVREGTRRPGSGSGLLTALVDAVEVGQTALDLARRGSPLVPAARGLARLAFGRAEAACRERGDAALAACADALREAARWLRDGE